TLDDGLVNLGAAIDVVRLRREQLLQDVRCAISFERPNFHFAEALAAELRLAAERLLRDERVWADGTRVNLVVDEMRQLEHIDVTPRGFRTISTGEPAGMYGITSCGTMRAMTPL